MWIMFWRLPSFLSRKLSVVTNHQTEMETQRAKCMFLAHMGWIPLTQAGLCICSVQHTAVTTEGQADLPGTISFPAHGQCLYLPFHFLKVKFSLVAVWDRKYISPCWSTNTLKSGIRIFYSMQTVSEYSVTHNWQSSHNPDSFWLKWKVSQQVYFALSKKRIQTLLNMFSVYGILKKEMLLSTILFSMPFSSGKEKGAWVQGSKLHSCRNLFHGKSQGGQSLQKQLPSHLPSATCFDPQRHDCQLLSLSRGERNDSTVPHGKFDAYPSPDVPVPDWAISYLYDCILFRVLWRSNSKLWEKEQRTHALQETAFSTFAELAMKSFKIRLHYTWKHIRTHSKI